MGNLTRIFMIGTFFALEKVPSDTKNNLKTHNSKNNCLYSRYFKQLFFV